MKIKNFEQNTLILDNFEGPLAFLHYLVHKSELDISEISMQEITDQYLKHLMEEDFHDLDAGADFIDHTGALIWLKSRILLPSTEGGSDDEEGWQCPFDIIPQLIEYCRFKDIARILGQKEVGQDQHYPRGIIPQSEDFPKPLGIERIGLDELESIFLKLLEKADQKRELIREEEWRVADKIEVLREKLRTTPKFHFDQLFSKDPCREEIVVTFLSLLELMKLGEMLVVKEVETERILIINPDEMRCTHEPGNECRS